MLKDFNVDTAIAPDEFTTLIQEPNASWNKLFKAHVTDEYEKWQSSGIQQYTNSEKMKGPSRRIVQ